jgi:lipid A oxidase
MADQASRFIWFRERWIEGDRGAAHGDQHAAGEFWTTLCGMSAILVLAVGLTMPGHMEPSHVKMSDASAPVTGSPQEGSDVRTRATTPEWAFGGYGGFSHTLPTVVAIQDGKGTDLKVEDFGWIARPFRAPPYYGARIQRWFGASPFGGMLDFTHDKVISKSEDTASFSGTLDGEPVPPKAKIGDFFSKLEFSHGHNMVTLNGLMRLAPWWARVRPYVGAGAGVSLPHSEVGIRAKKTRTYEYQYAGPVAQALAGVEVQLGHAAIFFEYKFSYAPYDIPLSHEPYGWLLVTDLWSQFNAWWSGTTPPGGRLRTTLSGHHAIAGVLVKNRSYMDRITK